MAQKSERLLPVSINLDTAYEKLDGSESPFIKNMESGINSNTDISMGTENPSGEGQNTLKLTPTKSNKQVPFSIAPAGYNKVVLTFESEETHELYYGNFNSNGNHGIYVVQGDTGIWTTVVIDPNLQFTDDQPAYMKDHRAMLRLVQDSDGSVLEKYLLLTDGNSWQKWINVIAAIKTNGFNASLFPYWSLLPPHFDRRELLEWPIRPCMYNPIATPLPNTPADLGKTNRVVDQARQFAVAFNYTDGRYQHHLSPYSLPVIIKTEDFFNDPDQLPKNIQVKIYAGSCMVESIDLYVRETAKKTAGQLITFDWGAWKKYDRIYKFSNCGPNSPSVIGTEYWKRTDPWIANSYDPIFNTILYNYDASKLPEIPIIDTEIVQNDMPLKSVALTGLGDAALLGDNLRNYNNLTCETTNNIDVQVLEKTDTDCVLPTRKIRLYCISVRPSDRFSYESQVGFFDGTDTTIRWGGLQMGPSTTAQIDITESKTFDLTYGGRNGPICYLKGTPFYSVGVLYQVNSDNSLIKVTNLIDRSNTDQMAYLQTVFAQFGYFVYVFDFEVPAGRYIAAMGRHNVSTNDDFRNTSTYVMGIANSRIKQRFLNFINGTSSEYIPTNAIQTPSKEQEIDCTGGDIDVWGNGHDLFYILTPNVTHNGNQAYRWIEGYLLESSTDPIAVELFPYGLNVGADNTGFYTDKNGFYFAFTKRHNSDTANIEVDCKFNCNYPFHFEIPTSGSGIGWMQNGFAYLTDHNNGVVGDCNRIVYTGKITNLDGTIPYSLISVSIKDGGTAFTKSDGTFILIVHNGQNVLRVSNVYINAGGNFIITSAACGFVPLALFDENLVPCVNCLVRNYPVLLNLAINAQGGTKESLKENSSYNIGVVLSDLAGRLSYVNFIKSLSVPSFLQRNDVAPTFFQMIVSGALNLPDDIKWFAPCVTPQINVRRYLQWVGDSMQYINNNGLAVTDPASAVFVSIAIDSFYNYAVAKNFSLISSYQFSPGDRLRILDDGDNNLLSVAANGDPIVVQVLGTNYNQAAMNSNLIPNTSVTPIVNTTINNTVNTSTSTGATTSAATTANNTSITIYVKYDSRLDKLLKKNGFWIELYTPNETTDKVPYAELQWHPIINGEPCDFTGYSNGAPTYNFFKQLIIDYWDTYLYHRNITIPNIGDKYFSHPFESPNVSDDWGAGITSGGRKSFKNDNGKQLWYQAEVQKSDNLTTGGILNGLGIFRDENRKDFSNYPWGAIVSLHSERSLVFFLCENDWFTTDYNFHYTYANEQGVMVTNLDNGLSTPHQKKGSNYGCRKEDTGTVLYNQGLIYWYDLKNAAWVFSDYGQAWDASEITDKDGRQYGAKSYMQAKSYFIGNWNLSHDKSSQFDVVAGIDLIRRDLYLTFRPRRKNSNSTSSYVNHRHNIQLNYQETIVFSLVTRRITRFAGFAPEGYGTLSGNAVGVEFFSFAAGLPYTHKNPGSSSYLNFYGVNTDPVVAWIANKAEDLVKVLQNIAFDGTMSWYFDLIYDDQPNSFSYLPLNYITNKDNIFYSEVLRDMVSYPQVSPALLFQSMLFDGKRIYGTFVYMRMIGDPNQPNLYRELNNIFYLFASSSGNRK